MAWSKFTDTYDEHENVEAAWFDFPPNPVGLHVLATTACNRWLSDGLVRPRWLVRMLPNARKRREVLAAMVEHRLFDRIEPGTVYSRRDNEGHLVTLGPFDDERFVVHDFLDHHDSARLVKERREADAARKRDARRKRQRGDSAGSPAGHQSDSDGSPVLRADAGGGAGARIPTRPDPTRPDPTDTTAAAVGAHDPVALWLGVLEQAGRRRRSPWASSSTWTVDRESTAELVAGLSPGVAERVMTDVAEAARAGQIKGTSLAAFVRGCVRRDREQADERKRAAGVKTAAENQDGLRRMAALDNDESQERGAA